MFNQSNYHAGNHTTNLKINAVTGAILKNHPKSWFERFNLSGKRAEELLVEGGHHAKKTVYDYKHHYDRTEDNPEKDITVLQMVICGEMEVLAELVYTKDYNFVETPKE